MTQGYIYKITNPKGAIYIGSTNNINRRKLDYKYLRCSKQIKIFRSLKKYGFDNHNFEVITSCDLKDIYFYENYYGLVYNVLESKNLNLKLPKSDDRFISISKETRIKIGLAHKGKIISEEQKTSMRLNLKKWNYENGHSMLGKTPWNKGKNFLKGELNPMFGIKRSEEWKKNHSDNCKIRNKKNEFHNKSKIVLNLENGVFHFTAREAAETYNIKYSTLKGKLNGISKNNLQLKYV
jgi:group I intron endonuclease